MLKEVTLVTHYTTHKLFCTMLISKNLMMIKTTLQINDEDEDEDKEINILLFYY